MVPKAPEDMPGGDPEGAEEKLKTLMEILADSAPDAVKFDAGNSAAGSRLRKKALQAAKQLKSLRAEVQSTKGVRKEEKAQALAAMMQQQQQAAQAQAQAEQAQARAPADKLFQPSEGGQPPAPAQAAPQGMPAQMQPKMASLDKEAGRLQALRAALGRRVGGFGRRFGINVDPSQGGMLSRRVADLSTGEKVLGLGLGAAGLTAGIRGADAAIDSIGGPIRQRKAFNAMMDENPNLKKEDQGDVKKIFRTLHTFNPDMAKDPLVAGSFMRRSLQYKDEGIQPQDVKTLAEINKMRSDSRGKESLLQAMMGAAAGGG